MTNNWRIRNAEAEDAAAIEEFLVAVPEFNGTLHPMEQRQVWQWLYSRAGEPIKNVLIAESPEGSVIAHYGLSRLPYVLAEHKVDAGLACLLAVDEKYRKTPLFLELTFCVLKMVRASGWTFATGLANRAGLLEFHKTFGFKDIGEVPVFAKPIHLAMIAKAMLPKALYFVLAPFLWFAQWAWLLLLRWRASAAAAAIRVEQVQEFDDALAATSAEIARYHKFFAERGHPALLNARFFGLTCRDYSVFRIVDDGKALGYFVLRLMDMKGFRTVGIVDVCYDFSRRDIARPVFRAIDGFAIERQAELVAILTNSAPLISQLRRNFFLRAPESFRLIIFEPARTFSLAVSRIDDWFVSWFEHDYV